MIIPAFLVQSEQAFVDRLRLVEGDCDIIQVDVLDGSLFPFLSWHNPEVIGQFSTTARIEAHLMVENPIPIIEQLQTFVPTFFLPIVHAEMHRPNGAVIAYIKDDLKLPAGIAINPETPLKAVEDVLHAVEKLTIMGVSPGASGQPFLGDHIVEKVRQARRHREDLIIEVDGGVTEALIPELIDAGADHLVCSSAIFSSENPRKQLQRLQRLVNNNIAPASVA